MSRVIQVRTCPTGVYGVQAPRTLSSPRRSAAERSNEVPLTSRDWAGDVGVSTVNSTSSMSPGDSWTGELAGAIGRTRLPVADLLKSRVYSGGLQPRL